MNSCINTMGGPSVPLAVVGELFEPGIAGNAQIAELMGFESKLENRAAWVKTGSEWSKTPNWCAAKGDVAKELLDELGAVYFCEKRQDSGLFITYVVLGHVGFVAKPQKTMGASLACAAHHCLITKSQMT